MALLVQEHIRMRNEDVVAALENVEASIEAALARGFRQIHEDLEKIHQAIKTRTR